MATDTTIALVAAGAALAGAAVQAASTMVTSAMSARAARLTSNLEERKAAYAAFVDVTVWDDSLTEHEQRLKRNAYARLLVIAPEETARAAGRVLTAPRGTPDRQAAVDGFLRRVRQELGTT